MADLIVDIPAVEKQHGETDAPRYLIEEAIQFRNSGVFNAALQKMAEAVGESVDMPAF